MNPAENVTSSFAVGCQLGSRHSRMGESQKQGMQNAKLVRGILVELADSDIDDV